METNKNARNGFTLPQVIKRIRQAMHNAKISMVIVEVYMSFGCAGLD
jgi:hypothetical protein